MNTFKEDCKEGLEYTLLGVVIGASLVVVISVAAIYARFYPQEQTVVPATCSKHHSEESGAILLICSSSRECTND